MSVLVTKFITSTNEFQSRADAEWWCDTHDIDHEFERVSYEVMGEVKP